jgi:hypothetical protein
MTTSPQNKKLAAGSDVNTPDWSAAFNYSHADRDAETAAFFGGGAYLGELYVPPPVPGVISQLEMLESPYITDAAPDTLEAITLAVYLLVQHSPHAMDAADRDIKLAACAEAVASVTDPAGILAPMFVMMNRGFELIPGTPGTNLAPELNQRQYDALWLSSCVSIGHRMTHKTDTQIIWETPLAALGFYAAELAREDGVKGVERKINPAAALAQLPCNRKQKLKEKG